MEIALRKILVDAATDCLARVYTRIPLSPTFPLMLFEINDHDIIQVRPEAQADVPGTLTAVSSVNGWDSFLVKVSIIDPDRSSVVTVREQLRPYIEGFSGISEAKNIAIFIESWRDENQDTQSNNAVGVFDLTVYYEP